MPRADLGQRALTCSPVGSTRPDEPRWVERPAGFRAFEKTVVVGHGQPHWQAASAAVLAWEVKTRSGFRVRPTRNRPIRAEQGADYWLVARWGPLAVHEPVRVVAVVEEEDRCGFAYGTLEGHPVSGEEAFVVHRSAGGDVRLTLRSLTRPAVGSLLQTFPWRPAFPLLLVAQHVYRRRYLRALQEADQR